MAFPRDARAIVTVSATMHSQTSSSLRRASLCPTRRSGFAREASSFPDETGDYTRSPALHRPYEWRRLLFRHRSWSEQMASRKKRAFLLVRRRSLAAYAWNVECKGLRLEHLYLSASLRNFRQAATCESLRMSSLPAKRFVSRRQQNV